MKSSSCIEKQVELKKGPWTQEEDQKLKSYIQLHGPNGGWSSLPSKAGLRRCGKSCRLRWNNYLRPDIKRGKFSSKEEQTIIQLHALLGNRWSVIAQRLPKRTDNEIKNYWNTCLKKRLFKMGINPTTHKPFKDDTSNISHMAQWESARLEAEARQVKEYCKLNQGSSSSSASLQPSLTRLVLNKVTPRPPPPPCLDVLKVWHNSRLMTSMSEDPNNTSKRHSAYAMMLVADDLVSSASTLTFPGVVPTNNFGANGDDGQIMVSVEASRSRGYNCNSMEGLHHEDVLAYNVGISDDFEEERQDWEAILELTNGFPSSPHFHG